jgi:hypothetical protein
VDSINRPLWNINGKCEGGETTGWGCMAVHCDSCYGQLWSPWRRVKRGKRGGGGVDWNAVVQKEYHGPAIERWWRRRPQVTGARAEAEEPRCEKSDSYRVDQKDDLGCDGWVNGQLRSARGADHKAPAVEEHGACGKKVTRPGIFCVTCCGTDSNSGHLSSTQILLPQRCPYECNAIGENRIRWNDNLFCYCDGAKWLQAPAEGQHP